MLNTNNHSDLLSREFEYYKAQQEELVELYEGKYLIIKDQRVVGAYGSTIEALNAAKEIGIEQGTFLLQHCKAGKSSSAHRFHSRVSFS